MGGDNKERKGVAVQSVRTINSNYVFGIFDV